MKGRSSVLCLTSLFNKLLVLRTQDDNTCLPHCPALFPNWVGLIPTLWPCFKLQCNPEKCAVMFHTAMLPEPLWSLSGSRIVCVIYLVFGWLVMFFFPFVIYWRLWASEKFLLIFFIYLFILFWLHQGLVAARGSSVFASMQDILIAVYGIFQPQGL